MFINFSLISCDSNVIAAHRALGASVLRLVDSCCLLVYSVSNKAARLYKTVALYRAALR